MPKLGTEIRLRHSPRVSDFAEVDLFTFWFFPWHHFKQICSPCQAKPAQRLLQCVLAASKAGDNLLTWGLHSESYTTCCLSASADTNRCWSLCSPQKSSIGFLLRNLREKTVLFCSCMVLAPFFHSWQTWRLLKEHRSTNISWLQVLHWWKSHPVTPALRPFETLVWYFRSASQHPSTAYVQMLWVHVNTPLPPSSTIWGVGYV